MLFRDYRPKDYNALVELWEELDMAGEERGDSKDIIEQCLKIGGRLILMVDEESKSIIGSSWMTFDGRRILLHHFGIRKAWQGNGLGTKLAHESLKHIKEKGYQVKLEVHKKNHIAKHLYEKLGFGAFTDYDIYMIRKTEDIEI